MKRSLRFSPFAVGVVAFLPVLLLLPPSHLSAQEFDLADGLVSITDVTAISPGEAMDAWIDAAVFPNGDLVVADMYTGSLARIGIQGELLWNSGGSGDGPGEFSRLYRVGVSPDGVVVAFDFSRRDLSFFSPDGEFIKRRQLELAFRQVDGVVPISDSLVAISGTVPVGMPFDDYAVHVFDDEGTHARSFGPLPETTEREVLGYWGAGMIRRAGRGEILYTRRLPYEVYRFDAEGTEVAVTKVAVPSVGAPEDRYEITRNGSYRVHRTDAVITRPITTIQVGEELLLTCRYEGGRRYMTLVREEDAVLADIELGQGQGIVIDGKEGVLWLSDSSSGPLKTILRARVQVNTPAGEV